MVSEIKDQNFEEEILKSELPVLVDFWAPWCGPCHMVSPVVEKLSDSYSGKFKFCKVNIDEAQITASKYGIMSIPTLMFFKMVKWLIRSLVRYQKQLSSQKLINFSKFIIGHVLLIN